MAALTVAATLAALGVGIDATLLGMADALLASAILPRVRTDVAVDGGSRHLEG